jgi:hypothetical protein
MPRMLTTLDVLSDVEFELAQSVISHDELGRSLQAVRQFQTKTRTEIFNAKQAAVDQREILNRQLQVQEMQTTVLQAMATAIQTLQLDVHRVGQLPPRETGETLPAAAYVPPAALTAASPSGWPADDQQLLWPTDLIEDAMKPDALKVTLEVRSSSTPVVGGILRRVRAAFHNLTLFYLQRISQKQTSVNQIYGERLLELSYLVQQQQQQIEALRAQVAALTGPPQES